METILTADGSHTVCDPQTGECFHSSRGAISESLHVFVNEGFDYFPGKSDFNILEIGFGTGLNAMLAMLEARKRGLGVYYETLEAFPLTEETYTSLNYTDVYGCNSHELTQLHAAGWGEIHQFGGFTFCKLNMVVADYVPANKFDIIYFDAFSPGVQPEMWTREIFGIMRNALVNGGILLTYSSKGTVKQALRDEGFTVQRIPGAGGKRHMLRAIKIA